MGIPSLTKHLSQYTETVVLSGSPDTPGGPPHVRSVVIDGPSLVYHVYYRLLACADVAYDALDIQPTCDEVSRGVVSFLLQLKDQGVEIHQICFDGALPTSKRDTRLARIEKSRQKLESCRQRPIHPKAKRDRVVTPIQPAHLWQQRHLPSRRRNLPENPFMVSAVYEDLRSRWSKQLMVTNVHPCAAYLKGGEYPWAKITTMVPGEADLDCARVTKLKGSAVLTNDSDLVVHDLGKLGSVVLLNSLQFLEDTPDLISPEIRGLRIHPHGLCLRLGIESLQRFAFELIQDPHRGFSDLVRLSKQDLGAESVVSFNTFLREFHDDLEEPTKLQYPGALTLDPRVSELFWQFRLPEIYCLGREMQPHIYLGILPEDHARQCAWEQGRIYRTIGYSLLNLAQPAARNFPVIHEFVRRGRRIVSEPIILSQAKTVSSNLALLSERLDLARSVFGSEAHPSFWVMFALSEIYRDCSNNTSLPISNKLEQFLRHGFTGKCSEWTDLHLLAQVHAILYSLRILKQLLGVTYDLDLSGQHRDMLSELPPLYLLVGSRHDVTKGFIGKNSVRESVSQLFQMYC
ncbi:hypothetical protein N7454_007575 [Penicillium verhagenii]|nr:hypothetical protein N7454_007575 [Penicillium verhagenii]